MRAMKGLPAAFGEEFFTNLADPLRALPDQIRKHGVDLVALDFHFMNAKLLLVAIVRRGVQSRAPKRFARAAAQVCDPFRFG